MSEGYSYVPSNPYPTYEYPVPHPVPTTGSKSTLDTTSVVFIILTVAFIILTAIFIGLFIYTRNSLATCQTSLEAKCPTCPECPVCPECPPVEVAPLPEPTPGTAQVTFTNGTIRPLATTTNSRNEEVIMTCPINTVIGDYQLYTKSLDTGKNSKALDISSLINARGNNSFSISASTLIRDAGIRNNKYGSNSLIYGAYTCTPGYGGNVVVANTSAETEQYRIIN